MSIVCRFRPIALAILLFLPPVQAASQPIDPAPDPALPYRLLPLPEGEFVLGLSPDSGTIVTGSSFPDYLRFYRASDFAPTAETLLPDRARLAWGKVARWSPDGKRVALRSGRGSPSELKTLKGSCIFIAEAESGAFIQLSDDRYLEKFSIQDPYLAFDPDFLQGNGEAFYHAWTAKGTRIVSVDPEGGADRILYAYPSRNEGCYAHPLSGSRLLLNISPNANSEPDRLIVFDARDGSSRIALVGEPGGAPSAFEILDVSAGGTAALVAHTVYDPKRSPNASMDALRILSFAGGVPSSRLIDSPDGHQILAARLSPDGKGIVMVVREEKPEPGSDRRAFVLRIDLAGGSVKTLLSDSHPFMVPGFPPASRRQASEGLFLSNGRLLLSCSDGYRLYDLD